MIVVQPKLDVVGYIEPVEELYPNSRYFYFLYGNSNCSLTYYFFSFGGNIDMFIHESHSCYTI